MLNYLTRRLGALVLVVIGVVTIVFFTVRAVPGDPVASILGQRALEVDKRALRQCLNLVHVESHCAERRADWSGYVERSFGPEAEFIETVDGECPAGGSVEVRVSVPTPLLEQYRLYWYSVLDGTFGELCGDRGTTVAEKLVANLPATLQLAAASLAVAILIAIPLGVIAALRPYSWIDNTSAVLALLGISIPNFWLGPMLLIVFSLSLQALPEPGSGVTGLRALVLPAVTLGTALAAKLTRMTRSSMLEVLGLDYVRTAKAKGAGRWRVVVKHALRNALIPVVTILGLQFGALLTGAIIVEKIFARPGLGTLLLEGIQQRNYRVVQGCVIFISLSYVVVNLLTDLLYAKVDPRIQYEERRFPLGAWAGILALWLAAVGFWGIAAPVAAFGGWIWGGVALAGRSRTERWATELGIAALGMGLVYLAAAWPFAAVVVGWAVGVRTSAFGLLSSGSEPVAADR